MSEYDRQNARAFRLGIGALARRAAAALPAGSPALPIARHRVRRPVDYMRYAEFSALLPWMNLDVPGGSDVKVLDLGSPQWFSIWLAARNSDIECHYANITPDELDRYRAIPKALGLGNLHYHRQDIRSLAFPDGTFDRVVSISVVEHVAPADGGDLLALGEIRRVLAPEGRLLLTVPLKKKGRILYAEGPVYERSGTDRTFFAREYDEASFRNLVHESGFAVESLLYICEKQGLLAPDYWEWGPGRDRPFMRRVIARLRSVSERVFRHPLDETLASMYLRMLPQPEERLVNVAACLRRQE